jgi:signal recognition particle subunit SRP54
VLKGLEDKFSKILNKLGKKNKLNDRNINDGIREIKLALLEADVNYKVVRDFVGELKEEALGEEVIKGTNPTQMFIKVVHDKLVEYMGGHNEEIKITGKNVSVIMLVGLQGSGKTTTAGKLAQFIKKKKEKSVALVGADVYRPAAQDQLETLAKQIDVPFCGGGLKERPDKIVKGALKAYKDNDVIIIDTAGRLQIDDEMMKELEALKKLSKPDEILFVSDAMAGQSVVDVVDEFNSRLGLTGVILTKFDSDARGGAALSIKKVTGSPIKFIGVGEKLDDLEAFHPERLAGRILGRGDIVSFVERAAEAIDVENARKLEEKLAKHEFDFEDFLAQIQQIKKMGSLSGLIDMIPMFRNMKPKEGFNDKGLGRIEAMIYSMTLEERKNHRILGPARKKRIAAGCGLSLQDVTKFITQFINMRKMMKKVMKNPFKMKQMLDGLGMGDMEGMGGLEGMQGLDGLGNMPGLGNIDMSKFGK